MRLAISLYRDNHVHLVRESFDSMNEAMERLESIAPWDDHRLTGWSVDYVHDHRITFELVDALNDYFGDNVPMQSIDVVNDPVLTASVWAIQVRWPDGPMRAQFLYHGSLHHVDSDELEQVDFGFWPPRIKQ